MMSDNEYIRYQTPTLSFITKSDAASWSHSCRRYHGIMKRFTDLEREMRIKTTRQAFGKAHLMAVKFPKVNLPSEQHQRERPITGNSVVFERRRDSLTQQQQQPGEVRDYGGVHTRRNSSVRLGTVTHQGGFNRDISVPNSAGGVKLPVLVNGNHRNNNYKTLLLNSSLSLQDLAPQPRPVNQPLHLIATLSPEAQYSMLRSYEQLIREELLMLKLAQDTAAAGSGYADETDAEDDPHNANQSMPAYLVTPLRPYKDDDLPTAESDLFSPATSGDPLGTGELSAHETRKMKVSQFMEIAVKILNIIEATRNATTTTMATRKNEHIRYSDVLTSTTPSVFMDDDDPFELYSRWAYLLNRELLLPRN